MATVIPVTSLIGARPSPFLFPARMIAWKAWGSKLQFTDCTTVCEHRSCWHYNQKPSPAISAVCVLRDWNYKSRYAPRLPVSPGDITDTPPPTLFSTETPEIFPAVLALCKAQGMGVDYNSQQPTHSESSSPSIFYKDSRFQGLASGNYDSQEVACDHARWGRFFQRHRWAPAPAIFFHTLSSPISFREGLLRDRQDQDRRCLWSHRERQCPTVCFTNSFAPWIICSRCAYCRLRPPARTAVPCEVTGDARQAFATKMVVVFHCVVSSPCQASRNMIPSVHSEIGASLSVTSQDGAVCLRCYRPWLLFPLFHYQALPLPACTVGQSVALSDITGGRRWPRGRKKLPGLFPRGRRGWGHVCSCEVLCNLVWSRVLLCGHVLCGHLWSCVVLCGRVLSCVDTYACVQSCVVTCDHVRSLWPCVVVCGHVRSHVLVCVVMCSQMQLCVVMCEYMSSCMWCSDRVSCGPMIPYVIVRVTHIHALHVHVQSCVSSCNCHGSHDCLCVQGHACEVTGDWVCLWLHVCLYEHGFLCHKHTRGHACVCACLYTHVTALNICLHF